MNLRKLQKLYRRSINRIIPSKARGRLPSVAKSLIVALLSFTLVITWGNAAWGQIPFLNLEESSGDRPIVDFFNRPYKCGNLVCSDVWFNGRPILTIASEPITQVDENPNFSAEVRAKRIQNTLKEVLKAAIGVSDLSLSNEIETEGITDIILLNKIPGKNPNSTPSQNALNPNLPQILVGTLNNETVIYVPAKSGSPNRKILTITTADVLHNGLPIEDLADQWRKLISSQLNKALQERELQVENPLRNPRIILGLFLMMVLLSLIVGYVQKKLRIRYKNLRKDLRDLESSITIDPESASEKKLAVNKENQSRNLPIISLLLREINSLAAILFLRELAMGSRETPEAKVLAPKKGSAETGGLEYFWSSLPKLSLKKQSLLQQQINILLLGLQGLLWLQTFIWLCGTAFILWIYPNTRDVGFLLIIKTLPVIGVWLLVTLLHKISLFAIDFNLNKWAENAQLTEELSPRYALRVSTYSSALKNLSRVISISIGAISTAEILGIATTVLASAGIVAAAIAYFSQNLVRDAINGLLILLTDRYAVGDVILVDDVGGFVEKMNLYMTNLRSADGELITIPNGSITVVRNLTKNWSRVNFTIEVAYDADIKRALQVLREVADQFYSEPEWREYLLEPIEVLGVDEISHAGMLVRIWLKTQPIKQWLVARGFRLRVKEAFDREGIAIGIPQRSLSVTNYAGFTSTNGKGKEQMANR